MLIRWVIVTALSALSLDNTAYSQLPSVGHAPLRLAGGDLIDALVFKRKYMIRHPDEDALILTDGGQDAGLKALVVYSEAGQVRVYAGGEIFPVAELGRHNFDDINKVKESLSAFWSTKPPKAEGDARTQLKRAFTAMNDFRATGIIPVSLKDTRSLSQGNSREALFFDWNGRYHTYQPETGIISHDYPKDTVTGEPYLCVKGGDVLECRKFYFDYLRVFPDERAALLIKTDSTVNSSHPSVAYTRMGRLYLFSPVFGHMPLDAKFTLDEPREIQEFFTEYAFDRSTSANEMERVVPVELPGDTGKRQVARAFQLSGGNKVFEHLEGAYLYGFRWDVHCYYYTSDQTMVYHGYFAPHQISSLVEDILYAVRFERQKPQEKVIVLNRAESGDFPRRAFALAVYTQGDDVFLYDTIVGDVKLAASRADITAANRDALLVLAQRANVATYKWQKGLRRQGATFLTYDTAQMSVDNVYDVFKRSRIPVYKISTRIRREDGSFRTYPRDALRFEWNGVVYTYSPEFGAFRTPGYFWETTR